MKNYLLENKNCSLSKIIFNIRSQTLAIKEWKPWNYEDNICVNVQFLPKLWIILSLVRFMRKRQKKIREMYLRILWKDKKKLEDL